MHFNHILITTDFSEDSYAAFEIAAYQAKMEGTKLSLINVFEEFQLSLELSQEIWASGQLDSIRKEYLKASEERLHKLSEKHFHDQNLACYSISTWKNAGDEICDFAKKENCDLIVMASHGRGTLSTLLIGSTVQRVLRNAPCPVLVTPKVKEKSNT